MFIHFLCFCPLRLAIMLNFNISKVAYSHAMHHLSFGGSLGLGIAFRAVCFWNARWATARHQLCVTSTSGKKPTKFAKTWGENVSHHMRHIFCEVTQRRDDEHSRTRRRLIQFNINCAKTHFLSDSQISRCLFPLLSLLFQAERYSLKEKWKGPAITIR